MLCVVCFFAAGADAGAAVRNPGGIAAEPSGASLVAIAPRSPAGSHGSHFLYLGQLALGSLDLEARPSLRAAANRGVRPRWRNPFRAVLALTTAPRTSAPARQKPYPVQSAA